MAAVWGKGQSSWPSAQRGYHPMRLTSKLIVILGTKVANGNTETGGEWSTGSELVAEGPLLVDWVFNFLFEGRGVGMADGSPSSLMGQKVAWGVVQGWIDDIFSGTESRKWFGARCIATTFWIDVHGRWPWVYFSLTSSHGENQVRGQKCLFWESMNFWKWGSNHPIKWNWLITISSVLKIYCVLGNTELNNNNEKKKKQTKTKYPLPLRSLWPTLRNQAANSKDDFT